VNVYSTKVAYVVVIKEETDAHATLKMYEIMEGLCPIQDILTPNLPSPVE
jgi:hypothetical protein